MNEGTTGSRPAGLLTCSGGQATITAVTPLA